MELDTVGIQLKSLYVTVYNTFDKTVANFLLLKKKKNDQNHNIDVTNFTCINSGTPCGSSESRASGPPGLAATAITGHSLNLFERKIYFKNRSEKNRFQNRFDLQNNYFSKLKS